MRAELFRAVVSLAFCVCVAHGAGAESFRRASANDITTLDPHANPDAFCDGVLHAVYERLAVRDRDYTLDDWTGRRLADWLRTDERHGICDCGCDCHSSQNVALSPH